MARSHYSSLGQLLLNSLAEEVLGTECPLLGTLLLSTDSLKTVLARTQECSCLVCAHTQAFPEALHQHANLLTATPQPWYMIFRDKVKPISILLQVSGF